MRLIAFIREHRSELDAVIKGALGRVPRTASCYCPLSGTDHHHETAPLNDSDRREWILSDESLYRWARAEGVRI